MVFDDRKELFLFSIHPLIFMDKLSSNRLKNIVEGAK